MVNRLPVILSIGSFLSFGSFGSYGSYGSFGSFRSFGLSSQHFNMANMAWTNRQHQDLQVCFADKNENTQKLLDKAIVQFL